MIERHWKGIAFADRAEDYVSHLKRETFPKLDCIDGFTGASILSRKIPAGVEFLIITKWRDYAAIEKFAGADAEAAVVPEQAQRMMVSFDKTVSHYTVQQIIQITSSYSV